MGTKLLDNLTSDDLKKFFGKADGSFDSDTALTVVKKAEDETPTHFVDSKGNMQTPEAIVSSMASVWSVIRSGAHINNALGNLGIGSDPNSNNAFKTAYNSGAMHGVSAIFSAVSLGVHGADKAYRTPEDKATMVAAGLNVLGTGGLIAGGQAFTPPKSVSDAQGMVASADRALTDLQPDVHEKNQALINAQNSLDAANRTVEAAAPQRQALVQAMTDSSSFYENYG